jgi:hypothetical protein
MSISEPVTNALYAAGPVMACRIESREKAAISFNDLEEDPRTAGRFAGIS